MSALEPAEGGCQCGDIRYRLTGEPVWLTVCHCNECKRQSGSAFGMSLRMRRSDVEVAGEPKRWTRIADSGNPVTCAFCPTCGTRVWHEPADQAFIHIKPGTLDDFSRFPPRFESFIERKAGWLQIAGIELAFEGQDPPGRPKGSA